MDSTNYSGVKTKLDKVGCGFCLAKWTQVTMHLSTGRTHSCHHPSTHPIPLTEIKRNPSALHNTRFKKLKRKEMLEGKRPSECNYCWNIEDNSSSFSDRVFKSSEPWSISSYDDIVKGDWREDFNPRYVEVSFSNTCNFKCAYCGPQYSSKWVEEIEQHGPYSDGFNSIEYLKANKEFPYKKSEHNPYIDAFWEWWPDLFKDLHTFRITGGEPLLSKDTFKVLDYIKDNFHQNNNLSLSINTNLGVPDNLIDKFILKAKDLCDNNKVRELTLFTSIEAEGTQAEYTRYGLDSVKFWNNVDKILTELPKVTITVMATFNALSVYTYGSVVDKVFELKKKHANMERYWISAIQLDTSYLRYPTQLSVKVIPDEDKILILKCAEKALHYGVVDFIPGSIGFSNTEIQKLKRTYDYAISKNNFDIEKNRAKLVEFVDELDKRRDTNFVSIFPELKKLYESYKK